MEAADIRKMKYGQATWEYRLQLENFKECILSLSLCVSSIF